MNILKRLFAKRRSLQGPLKERTVNVLVMGKAAVGKTSLIHKLMGEEGKFSEHHVPTLYEETMKEVNVDDYKITFKFMELGGSQVFPAELQIFIQQAHMYVLVYSNDDAESHSKLLQLRDQVVKVRGKGYADLPIIVVRNKADRRKLSAAEKARRKSVANWCPLNHNVSSKTGLRVNSVMDNLIEEAKFVGTSSSNEDENIYNVSGRYVNSKYGSEVIDGKPMNSLSRLRRSFHTMKKNRKIAKEEQNEKEHAKLNASLSQSMPLLKRRSTLGSALRSSIRNLHHRRQSLRSTRSSRTPSSQIGDGSIEGNPGLTVKKPLERKVSNSCPALDLQDDSEYSLKVRDSAHTYRLDIPRDSLDVWEGKDKSKSIELRFSNTDLSDLPTAHPLDDTTSDQPQMRTSASFYKKRSNTYVEPNVLQRKRPATFCIRNKTGAERRTAALKHLTKVPNRTPPTETAEFDLSLPSQGSSGNVTVVSDTGDSDDSTTKTNILIKLNGSDHLTNSRDIVNSDIVANSPQVSRRNIPWMRLKSMSHNNVADMHTVNVPNSHSKLRRLSIVPTLGNGQITAK